MEKTTIQKFLPHGIAIAIFIILSLIFFAPSVFDGRTLSQEDNNRAGASQAFMTKYRQQTGQPVLWTDAYFSGMPTAQIYQEISGNLTAPVFRTALLGQSVTSLHASTFLAMLSLYILLIVMQLDWRLAILGAVGFGISTFNMDILLAGHSTKMVALAFAPLIMAGAVLAFRGKILLGASIFSLATACQIYANHYQMTYYTFLALGIWGIFELVNGVRSGTIGTTLGAAAALVVGLGLGVLSNLTTLWTTNEYLAESTRGKTELSADYKNKLSSKGGAPASDANGGLSKDYAFGWSYGIAESLTLLVQNSYGGGASQNAEGTPAESIGMSPAALYIGSQPFVGVAIYFGAVYIFLCMLGMLLAQGRWKWAVFATGILMLGIAWGKNSPIALTLYEVLPYFNKFRAHTQALGFGQMFTIIIGMLALQSFFDPSVSNDKKQRALLISGGVTAALCLLAMMGDFKGAVDEKIQAQAPQMLAAVRDARAEMAKSDALRSLFLVLASAGILFVALRGFISKSWVAVAGIGLLAFGDVWTASRRVIFDERFVEKAKIQEEAKAKPVDEFVMKDTDLHYRVLDLRGQDPFQNAETSRFHKSLGGYHAAKPLRYQEMVERHLGNFEQKPLNEWKNMPLYGMLNAKYLILSDEMTGMTLNPYALGNAWFVKNIKTVDNADQEIEEVGNVLPAETAVMQKSYAQTLQGFTPQYDSTNKIKLTSYLPGKLTYEYTANADQLAVFSEIYYPKGWAMTIDGKETPILRANYLLRAAKVPSGSHKIEMTYKPTSYFTGEKISMAASGALLLAFIGGLFLYFRKNGLSDTATLLDLEKPTPPPTASSRPTAPVKTEEKKTETQPKKTLKRK